MRRLVLPLLLALLLLAVAIGIASLPGAVRLTVAGTTLDAATPTALALLLLLLAALYLVARLLATLRALPMRMRKRNRRRRRREGDAALVRALVALAANQPADAITEASRARRALGDTPYALLVAAQAHTLAGQKPQAAAVYALLADRPDSALIGLRGQAELAEAAADWPGLAAIALKAQRVDPGAAWVRALAATLAARGQDAAALARLAG